MMKKLIRKIADRGPVFPVQITLVFSMLVAAVGCFMGFGTDRLMTGIMVSASAVLLGIHFWGRRAEK